jgi:hypothetical protein
MAGAIVVALIVGIPILIIVWFANFMFKQGEDVAGLALVGCAFMFGLFGLLMMVAAVQIDNEVNKCHESGGQMWEERCIKSDLFVEVER